VVGIEVGVVSGVFNLESSGVDAPDWRPRHEEHHRHGHRSRSLTGTFGRVEIEVPRARLHGQDGKITSSAFNISGAAAIRFASASLST
jgi:hypothetical protein